MPRGCLKLSKNKEFDERLNMFKIAIDFLNEAVPNWEEEYKGWTWDSMLKDVIYRHRNEETHEAICKHNLEVLLREFESRTPQSDNFYDGVVFGLKIAIEMLNNKELKKYE